MNSRGCKPTEHVPEIFPEPERVEQIIAHGMVRPLRGRVAFARITVGWHPRLFMLDASGVNGARRSRRFSARMFETLEFDLDATGVWTVKRAEARAPERRAGL